MKNTNIGIVNLIISNELKNSYFSNTLIEESKKTAFSFLDIIKNSPILQLEFKVFDNIENKHIDNDIIATRYIDNNIKLFEVYTLDEIEEERKKLNQFITEDILLDLNEGNIKKVSLYNAIDCLIQESLNNYDKIDVDAIHESFTLVLNHIKEPKNLSEKILVESDDIINDDIIEIAIDKFNNRYETLNEEDKTLLQKLIKSTNEEKKVLLDEYKNENLIILETINENNSKDIEKNKINNAISKINEMVYNLESVDDDIIILYELKKNLI